MQIDPVFVSGAWWIDTDQAAELLRVSPATLQRHRQTVKIRKSRFHCLASRSPVPPG